MQWMIGIIVAAHTPKPCQQCTQQQIPNACRASLDQTHTVRLDLILTASFSGYTQCTGTCSTLAIGTKYQKTLVTWICVSVYQADYVELYVDTVHRVLREVDSLTSRPFVDSSPSNAVLSHDPYVKRWGSVGGVYRASNAPCMFRSTDRFQELSVF